MDNVNNKVLISIVLPCYNEEGNIEILYNKIKTCLKEYNLEYIFVEDNSSDNTLKVIENLANIDSAVKYISLSNRFGHQNSLRAGLEFASGDCIITMDSDLQHPPEILESLIQKREEGFDIVYTIRNDKKNISILKRLSSSLFYNCMNYLSDVELKYGVADFRLLDRKIVKVLVENISEYHLFYRGLIKWIGFNQTFVEYTPSIRYSGKTKYNLSRLISFAFNGITSFSIKPLKLAMFLGLILSSLSFVYAVYALYIKLFTNILIQGWTSILFSVLFIGGINMVLLGIIGEYLGKIFMQTKNRPFYLIKKTNISHE